MIKHVNNIIENYPEIYIYQCIYLIWAQTFFIWREPCLQRVRVYCDLQPFLRSVWNLKRYDDDRESVGTVPALSSSIRGAQHICQRRPTIFQTISILGLELHTHRHLSTHECVRTEPLSWVVKHSFLFSAKQDIHGISINKTYKEVHVSAW